MSASQACIDLLHELGRRYHIDGLAFDAVSGLCLLGFDRRLKVWLAPDTRADSLALCAVLGAFTPSARPDLMLAMLAGNFNWRATGGATLAFDIAAGMAVLTLSLPLAGLDGERLETRLNAFVDTALEWAERLSQPPGQAEPPTTPEQWQLLA
ncbi:type III secretion system chaperone [Rugamonas aquatica]|nr:type III secretion system chaperone [Rugamonas aquatica]